MTRNSLGQIIVNETGSMALPVLCLESTISIPVYNRFLLDNKEFTELVPTVDKDALIKELSTRLESANLVINTLSSSIANSSGGTVTSGSGTSGGGGGSLGGGGNGGNVFPL
jgi:uncharacterized membrane protein YgcG